MDLMRECEAYLGEMGFVKDDVQNSRVWNFPSCNDRTYSITLFEIGNDDDTYFDFKYLDKKGEIIYKCEMWKDDREGEYDTVIDLITVRELGQLKFLVEGTRIWRTIQLSQFQKMVTVPSS